MAEKEFPKIEVNGKIYWQVGCKKCGRGNTWSLYFDSEKNFIVKCECGNTINSPDGKTIIYDNLFKTIDMRMIL